MQGVITCLLGAMPLCLMPADSPALLKALTALIGSPIAKHVSFVTKEAFFVPIHQVRLTGLYHQHDHLHVQLALK